MAVILDAEMGKTSMRSGMMGDYHNEYVFEVELLAVVLCVAGTLTTAAFDQAGRLHCRRAPNGSTLDKRGGLRLVSSKVFLSPNVRLSDETWRNIRSGPCWNPLGT